MNDHEEFEIYHGLSESMITASTLRSRGKHSLKQEFQLPQLRC